MVGAEVEMDQEAVVREILDENRQKRFLTFLTSYYDSEGVRDLWFAVDRNDVAEIVRVARRICVHANPAPEMD